MKHSEAAWAAERARSEIGGVRTPTDDIGELREVISNQLVRSWADLDEEIASAMNGTWSIKCDACLDDIAILSRAVGPVDWESVSVVLLSSGVASVIHRALGYEEWGADCPIIPKEDQQ